MKNINALFDSAAGWPQELCGKWQFCAVQSNGFPVVLSVFVLNILFLTVFTDRKVTLLDCYPYCV
jgi:hypothetical protein